MSKTAYRFEALFWRYCYFYVILSYRFKMAHFGAKPNKASESLYFYLHFLKISPCMSVFFLNILIWIWRFLIKLFSNLIRHHIRLMRIVGHFMGIFIGLKGKYQVNTLWTKKLLTIILKRLNIMENYFKRQTISNN